MLIEKKMKLKKKNRKGFLTGVILQWKLQILYIILWEMEVSLSIGNQQKTLITQVIYKKDKG